MSQKIYSFSIPDSERSKIELVERLRADCRKTGRSFSWTILAALAKYQEFIDESA